MRVHVPIHVCAVESVVYVCVSASLSPSLPPSFLCSFSLFFFLLLSYSPPSPHPPSFFPCAVQFLDPEQINRGRRGGWVGGGGGREVFMWQICSLTVTAENESARKEATRKVEVKEKMVFSLAETTLMGYCEPIMFHSH